MNNNEVCGWCGLCTTGEEIDDALYCAPRDLYRLPDEPACSMFIDESEFVLNPED
jgi:hypothetical protein